MISDKKSLRSIETEDYAGHKSSRFYQSRDFVSIVFLQNDRVWCHKCKWFSDNVTCLVFIMKYVSIFSLLTALWVNRTHNALLAGIIVCNRAIIADGFWAIIILKSARSYISPPVSTLCAFIVWCGIHFSLSDCFALLSLFSNWN